MQEFSVTELLFDGTTREVCMLRNDSQMFLLVFSTIVMDIVLTVNFHIRFNLINIRERRGEIKRERERKKKKTWEIKREGEVGWE